MTSCAASISRIAPTLKRSQIRGGTPELLNNHGYSYILRGDYKNARIKLAEAKSKDPRNKYIQNNIDLLEDSIRNAR